MKPPDRRSAPRQSGTYLGLGCALVLIGLGLSACGTEATPTSAAASATPAPSDPAGKLIQSTPAPPVFVDRARAVADVVRAAGIPKPPEGIFLRSSRTPGLAFDTTEQKLAWSAGQVTIAPGVDRGSGGTTRLDFADGSSLQVSVLDAVPALIEAMGSTRSNCRGVPSCHLTITGASLKTAEVDTSSGPTTVPAWSFTAKGLSRPILVIAVSSNDLKPRHEPIPPPGVGEPPPGLLQVESLTRVEGNILTFMLSHGSCDSDLQAQVVEFDDLVVIGGTYTPPTTGCDSAGHRTPATITLATPLADRAVITATTGVRLTSFE